MLEFTTFCRVENKLFSDLINSKKTNRFEAKKYWFFIEYKRFLDCFYQSGMTWEQFKKTLVLVYKIR